ncbi:flagellar basal body rod protein FlgC (plasmid) [Vibrio breoganii]|uniref:Flagellar basal-body rod protein FlgC n=1 Tax=Vibrio breoganii TaxID=553239 RepID=A0AAN0XZG4_9VIBR|nr:flagellar basal body rod protein FlgC [Vibrio breoganii]ANO35289.1 flagellar basal body rod protein FlgC [Vibrio breoganii]PML12789.1 flagellar basal body rod protein FlgC [Vibrio breoganii]
MSLNAVFDVAGSAMAAQTVRLNAVSSNIANMDSVAATPEEVYKPLKPVFVADYTNMVNGTEQAAVPVRVADVIEVKSMAEGRYEPNNPLSNEQGYVYYSGINVVSEMADMMSATKGFEANASVMSNVKSMQQSLLRLWE